jgi:hypothetical protein
MTGRQHRTQGEACAGQLGVGDPGELQDVDPGIGANPAVDGAGDGYLGGDLTAVVIDVVAHVPARPCDEAGERASLAEQVERFATLGGVSGRRDCAEP